jgi:hypothetical protein
MEHTIALCWKPVILFYGSEVPKRMAHGAECDQIFFGIIAALAAKFFVVNLQV